MLHLESMSKTVHVFPDVSNLFETMSGAADHRCRHEEMTATHASENKVAKSLAATFLQQSIGITLYQMRAF